MYSSDEPVDHKLMMDIVSSYQELGDLLAEFAHRMTPKQERVFAALLPIFSSILSEMSLLLAPDVSPVFNALGEWNRSYDA